MGSAGGVAFCRGCYLAELTGQSIATIRRHIAKLIAAGYLQRAGRGRYRLTQLTRDAMHRWHRLPIETIKNTQKWSQRYVAAIRDIGQGSRVIAKLCGLARSTVQLARRAIGRAAGRARSVSIAAVLRSLGRLKRPRSAATVCAVADVACHIARGGQMEHVERLWRDASCWLSVREQLCPHQKPSASVTRLAARMFGYNGGQNTRGAKRHARKKRRS